jgi:hypothetical protein
VFQIETKKTHELSISNQAIAVLRLFNARTVLKHYEGSRVADRAETITIKQINFQFEQSVHCLEFYWTATDRDEKRFYDRQTYIYCPGQSMVSQIQH